MIRRAALLVSILFVAGGAQASWYPIFEPSYLQLRPGQSADVPVRGSWLTGISLVPFSTMTFAADDPSVASVTGILLTPAPGLVRVTALQPGVTRVRVLERGPGPVSPTSLIIVVAEETLPVAVAIEGILAPNNTITLRAVSDEPEATFTWYSGRLGGISMVKVGSDRELKINPSFSLRYEYWVLMTTPRGAGSTGVIVDVIQPRARRRAVRS